MSTTWASKMSRIRSPTRSYIASISRFCASPRWTSLISASSALRWRGLLEQPRVLQRDAEAAGEGRQEPNVGVGERVLPVEVAEQDHAGRLRCRRRAERIRPTRDAALVHDRVAELDGALLEALVDQERFLGLDHVLAEPDHLHRLVREPLAPLDRVREVEDVPSGSRTPMSTICASKMSCEPVADEVVHRLRVQVLDQAALDLVDQGELGVALAGLLEQPRVLEGDAEAPGERRQQTHVRLAERVLPVDVLQRDHPGRPPADRRGARTRRTAAARRTARAAGRPRRQSRATSSFTRTGSIVSIATRRNPTSAIGSSWKRTPRLDRVREVHDVRVAGPGCRCRRPGHRRSP